MTAECRQLFVPANDNRSFNSLDFDSFQLFIKESTVSSDRVSFQFAIVPNKSDLAPSKDNEFSNSWTIHCSVLVIIH